MPSEHVTRQFCEGAEGSPQILALQGAVRPAQQRVLEHPLYHKLDTLEDLKTFAEFHVFAVWDFMCLLKALQRHFTCIEVPWLPTTSVVARRLINEIVLIEETDTINLQYLSHFELYLAAMDDIGANTDPIRTFIQLVADGVEVSDALVRAGAPEAATAFVRNTWDIVTSAPIHGVAAAFALTREDLIPEMFEKVLQSEAIEPGRLDLFTEYLRRHIQVDSEVHTPMAMQLLLELCGTDGSMWAECASIAERCFDARSALWTGICESIDVERSRCADRVHMSVRLEIPGITSAEDLEVVSRGGRISVRNRRTGEQYSLAVLPAVEESALSARFEFGTLEISFPVNADQASAAPCHVVPVHGLQVGDGGAREGERFARAVATAR